MWDLLEHLAHPTKAIKQVHAMLNPGGLLALEVPVRDSLLHWIAKASYRLSFGWIVRPVYLVCGVHHLQYFSERSVKVFLEQCDFQVIECCRAETDISALKRNNPGLKSRAYNMILETLFFLARILKKENKIVIIAKKNDDADNC